MVLALEERRWVECSLTSCKWKHGLNISDNKQESIFHLKLLQLHSCYVVIFVACGKRTGTSSYDWPVVVAELSAIFLFVLLYLAGGPVWNGLITVTAAAAC